MNFLSFDVEEWFHSSNFEGVIQQKEWPGYAGRVIPNVRRILEILDQANVKATFFVLGWIAEQFPHLVVEIAQAGHEVGSHGYNHRLIYNQTPEEFRADILCSLNLLKEAGVERVLGYRAPSYTITQRTLWALEILFDLGFRYDSSVFPIRFHDRYGIPEAPRRPYLIKSDFVEFPMTALRILGVSVPIASGAYFRLTPYSITKLAMKWMNGQGFPVTVNIHPWEMDPAQPRIDLPTTSKLRHYTNLDKTEKRLQQLVKDFEFSKLSDGLEIFSQTNCR